MAQHWYLTLGRLRKAGLQNTKKCFPINLFMDINKIVQLSVVTDLKFLIDLILRRNGVSIILGRHINYTFIPKVSLT